MALDHVVSATITVVHIYVYMDSTHDGLGGVLEDLFVTFVRAAGQVVGIVHEVAGQHQFTVHALTDGVLLPCCVYNTKEK